MEQNTIKKIIGETFLEVSKGLKTGEFGKKIVVGLTTIGSEHGTDNLVRGAELAVANNPQIEVVLIGPKAKTTLRVEEATSEEEAHAKMESLLKSNVINTCVTMHYNFNIGTSTVGKVITPAMGREMFLATTTGTSAVERNVAMVKNALYGIITAKTMGIAEPTVGIMNVDSARQVERALKELASNGYPINFAESMRADGGTIMRGNDLLSGTCDVMVMDTLTGNLMMKVFSSFNTGGSYEASGFGYGPGIGMQMSNIILILSRASGVPVVAGAIAYAAKLAKNNLISVAKDEIAQAKKAKLDSILENLMSSQNKTLGGKKEFVMPKQEVVTAQISGIDIMDLEDAVSLLLENGIYAESGMGCTGPIALVSPHNEQKATSLLCNAKYIMA